MTEAHRPIDPSYCCDELRKNHRHGDLYFEGGKWVVRGLCCKDGVDCNEVHECIWPAFCPFCGAPFNDIDAQQRVSLGASKEFGW